MKNLVMGKSKEGGKGVWFSTLHLVYYFNLSKWECITFIKINIALKEWRWPGVDSSSETRE
jgi:hypothetical protein